MTPVAMCTLLFIQVRHAVAVQDCNRPKRATRIALQGLRLHHHEARHRDEEARAQKTSCSPYAFKGSKDKAWAYAPTRAHGNCPFLANALPSLPHAHCRTQPRPPRLMPQPASPKLFPCCATADSPNRNFERHWCDQRCSGRDSKATAGGSLHA